MLFWLTALGLTLIVAAALVYTLFRARRSDPSAVYDMRIYQDQLKELDRDRARGLISDQEAEGARVEISRRLLEADKKLAQTEADTPQAPRAASAGAAGVIVLAILGISFALYASLGAPGYPDLPMQARIAASQEARATRPGQQTVEESLPPAPPAQDADPAYLQLVERLRETMTERQDDPRGFELLTRSETILGNYGAAYRAKARAIELKGEQAAASDYADLADLMVLAAGGYVSPEAELNLQRALERDPRNGTALYYSGLMMMQVGRPDLGFRIWRRQLDAGPADAPWITPIRAQIEEAAALAGEKFSLQPQSRGAPLRQRAPFADGGAAAGGEAELRGPNAEDMQAAAEMSAEDRQAMIRGMVEQLSSRLANEGGSPAEWARLIRALGVLGETDRAQAITEEARQVFASDSAALAAIEAAAGSAPQ